MSENSIKKVGTEVLKEGSKDIYYDGLKPAVKESGEALQAIVGLINNVLLYPIKKANIKYKCKLAEFEESFKLKIEKIPDDKLIEPPLNIAGPTLEALKYTFDTKELREMYMNLLASAMNYDTVKNTHPAYVDIIKSMSPLDAVVLKKIVLYHNNIPCARVLMAIDNNTYLDAMPKIFVPDIIDKEDPFLVSSSIQNLCRLGILTLVEEGIESYNYNLIKKNDFVLKKYEKCKNEEKENEIQIMIKKQTITINDFGRNFAESCLYQ
ncbi:DUF4393 domain-containing protein [Clostridium ihumii]|uniref:DUF4393 domain-containing protein n=1 Tax=Clostridium ihumii TaxID=1470356 RepID=UPI000555928B|nr:DUF4393 domain-containing protein [Clostridium ihumii]